MSGTRFVLLFTMTLLQAFSQTVVAGPWKTQWGNLFPAESVPNGSSNAAPADGLHASVFDPLSEALSHKRMRISFEVVDALDGNQEAKIEPEFSRDRLDFKILVTKGLTEKPALMAVRILPLLSLAGGYQKSAELMIDSGHESSQQALRSLFLSAAEAGTISEYSFLELLSNLEAGSPSAKARWAQRLSLWLSVLKAPSFLVEGLAKAAKVNVSVMDQEISRIQAEELARVNAELPVLRKEANAFRSRQEKIWNDWKKETQAFEKLEAMELKLNDLIVRNDRRGVRRLIETYLPWPLMEPSEAKIWKSWLDAIEFPRADKTKIAFRGVDYKTDFIQRLETPEGTKIGFMSTLLTKNQGSYTRRLRSLSTKRLENADDESMALKKTGEHYKIADQMRRHSIDPIGSVFLSFTPLPAVAVGFVGDTKFLPADSLDAKPVAGGGLLAVKMDSRRLIPNLSSRHVAEYEYLAPLVIFPDEIVKYEEFEQHKLDGDRFQRFVEDVSRKTGQKFSMEFGVLPPDTMTSYYKDGLDLWKDMRAAAPRGAAACSKVFN